MDKQRFANIPPPKIRERLVIYSGIYLFIYLVVLVILWISALVFGAAAGVTRVVFGIMVTPSGEMAGSFSVPGEFLLLLPLGVALPLLVVLGYLTVRMRNSTQRYAAMFMPPPQIFFMAFYAVLALVGIMVALLITGMMPRTRLTLDNLVFSIGIMLGLMRLGFMARYVQIFTKPRTESN